LSAEPADELVAGNSRHGFIIARVRGGSRWSSWRRSGARL
jgi:hypothetical protein